MRASVDRSEETKQISMYNSSSKVDILKPVKPEVLELQRDKPHGKGAIQSGRRNGSQITLKMPFEV